MVPEQVPGHPRPGGGRARPGARDRVRRAAAGRGARRRCEAWGLRREHHRAGGAAYLLAAINEGPAAGASLDHSHSQLVPFADVPPAVAGRDAGVRGAVRAVRGRRGRGRAHHPSRRTACARSRPGWSRFAYELWIVPDAHAGEVAAPGAARPGAAATRPGGCVRCSATGLAWNAVLHAPPLRGDDPYHWHIEIWPRLDGGRIGRARRGHLGQHRRPRRRRARSCARSSRGTRPDCPRTGTVPYTAPSPAAVRRRSSACGLASAAPAAAR